jgi:hypothetical protein
LIRLNLTAWLYILLLISSISVTLWVLLASNTDYITKFTSLSISNKLGDSMAKYYTLLSELFSQTAKARYSTDAIELEEKRIEMASYGKEFMASGSSTAIQKLVMLGTDEKYLQESSFRLGREDFGYYFKESKIESLILAGSNSSANLITSIILTMWSLQDNYKKFDIETLRPLSTDTFSLDHLLNSTQIGLANLKGITSFPQLSALDWLDNKQKSQFPLIILSILSLVLTSLIKTFITCLVILRGYLWSRAWRIVEIFYYNLALLNSQECADIRRLALIAGASSLMKHLSIETSVGIASDSRT